MIGLGNSGVRIFVATKPVDFRKGMDSLAAVVQQHLRLDPFCGAAFVFRAKRGDRMKILVWDGTGLVMAYKRLEDGKFAWPSMHDGVMKLTRGQFEALFEGLDWRKVYRSQTRRPAAAG